MQASVTKSSDRPRVARSGRFAAALLVLGLAVSGCTTGQPAGPGEFNDPYEGTNRKIHNFNKGVDRVVYRPVSNVYGTVLPKPVRQGVLNFADAVDTPRRIVNNVLQGDIEDGVHNFFRFAVNATVGVLGIFDPATAIGIESRDTDFGETLHVWGVGEGAYVSVPFFGPSTQRDLTGDVVDLITNPLNLIIGPPESYVATGAKAGEFADERYTFRDSIDDLLDNSADSYAQARQIYIESRRFDLGVPAGGASADGGIDPYADGGIDPYEEF